MVLQTTEIHGQALQLVIGSVGTADGSNGVQVASSFDVVNRYYLETCNAGATHRNTLQRPL
jgi:hypothetical protein